MMQQGGGAPTQSQYREITPAATAALSTHMPLAAAAGTDQSQQQHQIVVEASPISSRPPAAGNLDEFMRLSADEDEADQLASVSTGNRWPRQETLALLQIRSDMDAAFRDATVKGPLWEHVSRKLAELGYKRSAKKCKEKFENVHKYYKRTKEGRAGRQAGKSYRFFSQLEALHNTNTNAATTTTIKTTVASACQPTTTLDVAPVSVGIPMPVSSVRVPPSTVGMSSCSIFPPDFTSAIAPAPPQPSEGISFSSTSSGSFSSSSQEKEEDDVDEPSNTAPGSSRKRKTHSSKGGTSRVMTFFEGLMKHVMQKQEAMQQRFLDAIEKRENDRMIREEIWKRQEMARLSREHELMAQEREISASRDAAIVAFLQKITGQTIQLPSSVTVPPPPPQPQPLQLAPVVTVSTQHPPPSQPQLQLQQQPQPAPVSLQQQDKHQQQQIHNQQQSSICSGMAMGVPELENPPQEFGSVGSIDPASSRWPKAEVLVLIKLRSALESRYQEAGPKGPLWEEISAGMHRMGYKRNAKRCKEKWENINKYFKKVKESNKKRPEDAKTCPYFHELDALYRKKILGSSNGGGGGGGGGSGSDSGFANQSIPEEPLLQQQQQQESMPSGLLPPPKSDSISAPASESQIKSGGGADANAALPRSLFGEGNTATKKPEDIVKELIKLQGPQKLQQQLMVHDYEKTEEGDYSDSDNGDDAEENKDDEDDDDELQEERKMAYKIEFQRQNTSASNPGGNGAPSFLAIVQ